MARKQQRNRIGLSLTLLSVLVLPMAACDGLDLDTDQRSKEFESASGSCEVRCDTDSATGIEFCGTYIGSEQICREIEDDYPQPPGTVPGVDCSNEIMIERCGAIDPSSSSEPGQNLTAPPTSTGACRSGIYGRYFGGSTCAEMGHECASFCNQQQCADSTLLGCYLSSGIGHCRCY